MTATVETLRDYLLAAYGTDYGVSDDVLQAQLDRAVAIVKESRRRWSPTVLAAEEIKKAAEGPSDA